ncbi:Probable serine/threonine-protein kinase SIS8 [Linum grandiflorum]
MDRNLGKVVMDQKNYDQARYGNVESRNEGPSSANQRFMQDPSTNINTNLRPPDYNVSIRARPVLNYSIQTGEEFALEFMRERVNPQQQQFFPNSYGDPTSGSTYMDLKGSESGSDVAMVNSNVEKGRTQDFERKAVPTQDHDSVRSVPRTSSRNDNSRATQSYTSSGPADSLSAKVKFLCSSGGTILPRPSDGKLRYVGGETRIIRIRKNISWQELGQKTLAICNQPHTIKYQLPGEDLDALVSVSCDEDLQNMMEECSILDDGGSQKPRMFLFSSNDLEDGTYGLGSVDCDSEIQYVVAVNGMDFGSRKSSINLASASGNNLDELLSLNVERENSRIAADISSSNIAPLAVTVPPSQSSQPVAFTSTVPPESSSQPYQGQSNKNVDPSHYPATSMQPVGSLPQRDGISSNSSVTTKYVIGTHPSGHGTSGELLTPLPPQGHPTQKGDKVEETRHGGFHMHNTEASVKDSKLKRDGSSQKLSELEKKQSVDKDAPKELKMKRDGSLHKINEIVSASKHGQKEEFAVSNPSADPGLPVLPTKSNARPQEGVQNPKSLNDGKKNTGDDRLYSSGGSLAPQSEADLTDFSYPEQPVVPQPVFHSERFPREQAELHRLSKSEDSFDPQVLITQARSGHFQPVNDSVDKSPDATAALLTEQSHPSAKGHHVNPQTVDDGLAQFEKYKELADNIGKINSHVPQVKESNMQKSEPRHVVFNSIESKETAKAKEKKEGTGLMHPTASETQGTSNKRPEGSAIGSAESDRSEVASNRNIVSNAKGHPQLPKQQMENPSRTVSTAESAVIGTPEQITIDINERFSRDFLSDIFSQAQIHDNSSATGPLHIDGTGLSLNMENHDPKRWSYFRNLAQNQFVRKDVSLMDQDHLCFPPSSSTVEGSAPLDYSYPPFKSDSVSVPRMDPPINFDEDIQQKSGVTGTNTLDYSHSQLDAQDNVHMDGISSRIPESAYEEDKSNVNTTGGTILDISLGEIDISTLQIIDNEDLEELRELGSGTFGTVYHGKWRGSDVAIKRIKKSCFTGRSSEQERLTVEFWREADILSKLHHPNVVAFYGVVQDGPGGTMATVTEYMVNGSLRHVLLSKERHLDRRKRLIIAMDAAFGMEYLHSKNIVHFDLKCDNLLVNLKDPLRPICKVGDFGLSKIKRNTLVTGGVRGTLPWMAPELLNGSSSKVSEKVDVFSFGIVLWEILTGEEPYANMHYGAIIGGIVNNTLRPPVPSFCDSEWKLLMEQCWAPDPLGRPSFTEIARRLRVMSAAASQTRQQPRS